MGDVTGGSTSIGAATGSLRGWARTLDDGGDDLRTATGRISLAVAGLPRLAAIKHPVHASGIAFHAAGVVMGPTSLLRWSVTLEGTAIGLRFAAWAYEESDRQVRRRMEDIQVALGPAVMLGLMVHSTVVAAASQVPDVPGAADDVVRQHAVRASPGTAHADSFGSAFRSTLLGTYYDHPWLTGFAVGAARSAPEALGSLATGGAPVAGPGGPSLEERCRQTLFLAALMGRGLDTRPVTATPTTPPDDSPAPADDVGGLLGTIDDIDTGGRSTRDRARVRVTRVVDASGAGRWVVSIPGTKTWFDPDARNPIDGASNLALMAGIPVPAMKAIESALRQSMRRAGVPPGREPVMMTGHSQGGLLAARMASDPQFQQRYRVTQLVTAGSPISRIDVPSQVTTLAVEHRRDPVPDLDQQDDPSRRELYHADLTADGSPSDQDENRRSWTLPSQAGPTDRADSSLERHDAGRYARSMDRELGRTAGGEPLMQEWRSRGGEDFFVTPGRTAAVYDYDLSRAARPPRGTGRSGAGD